MAKKSKILIAFLLALLVLASIIPIKSLATEPTNSNDMVVIKENDDQYLIYVEGLLDEDFEFAFTKALDADNMHYIPSIKDNDGNSIAYVDYTTLSYFFEVEGDTYIVVKDAENQVVVDGEVITIDNARTVQELKTIENLTKLITVESSAENEKITIDGAEGTDYYYQFFVPDSSEEYTKLLNLVDKVSKFNDNTDLFTKLQSYTQLENVYSTLVSKLNNDDWKKAENLEITKPYGATEDEQYVLWLKDSNGNIDVQFLTAYEEEVTLVDEVQKTEEVTVALPVTYDDMTGLFIALAVVALAIVIIVAMKIISKRRRA